MNLITQDCDQLVRSMKEISDTAMDKSKTKMETGSKLPTITKEVFMHFILKFVRLRSIITFNGFFCQKRISSEIEPIIPKFLKIRNIIF